MTQQKKSQEEEEALFHTKDEATKLETSAELKAALTSERFMLLMQKFIFKQTRKFDKLLNDRVSHNQPKIKMTLMLTKFHTILIYQLFA